MAFSLPWIRVIGFMIGHIEKMEVHAIDFFYLIFRRYQDLKQSKKLEISTIEALRLLSRWNFVAEDLRGDCSSSGVRLGVSTACVSISLHAFACFNDFTR